MRFPFKIYLAISFLFIALPSFSQENKGYEYSLELIENCLSINTLSFDLTKTERIEDEYHTESFSTKLSYDPFMVYSKKKTGSSKPELLYIDGQNDNKALINPDGFPWFNLNLDPAGSIMRKDQHHTLHRTGYRFAMSILDFLIQKYGEEVPSMTSLIGEEEVNGHMSWIVQFDNRYFKYIDYTVGENESITEFAEHYNISEYMIIMLNDDIDDFEDLEDVEAGDVLRIPNDYCPKMIMAIDQKRLIPLSLKVFDDKGLYEQFEYNNVVINPSFDPKEFTEEYPGYGF